MKSRVVKGITIFKPVTIEVTLESMEELKDFELRMALYTTPLMRAATGQGDLEVRHPAPVHSTAPSGISNLRAMLHKLTGEDSYITNPTWQNKGGRII